MYDSWMIKHSILFSQIRLSSSSPSPRPLAFSFQSSNPNEFQPVLPSSRMENRISSADSQASERLNRNDERRETGSGSAASSLLGKNLVCANFDSCSQAKRSELPEE